MDECTYSLDSKPTPKIRKEARKQNKKYFSNPNQLEEARAAAATKLNRHLLATSLLGLPQHRRCRWLQSYCPPFSGHPHRLHRIFNAVKCVCMWHFLNDPQSSCFPGRHPRVVSRPLQHGHVFYDFQVATMSGGSTRSWPVVQLLFKGLPPLPTIA